MRNKAVKALLIGTFVYILAGCASAQLTSREYLLMNNAPQTVRSTGHAQVAIELMPVQVADYLAGTNIVLLSKHGEVYRSQQNLWAESLSSQLERLTRKGLAERLPQVTWYQNNYPKQQNLYKLIIKVTGFYGDLDGQAHVSGDWTLISASGQVLKTQMFDQSEDLTANGYTELVQVLSRTWFEKVLDPMSNNLIDLL